VDQFTRSVYWSLAYAGAIITTKETRLEITSQVFGPGLPNTGPLRCHLYPQMNDSRSPWTGSWGPVTARR
jgi:hypothetical protein